MWRELGQWVTQYASKTAAGVIILLIGLVAGVLVRKLLLRVLREIGFNRIMAKVNVQQDMEKGISITVSLIIYLVTIVLFLEQLGIQSIVLYLLVAAVLMLFILTFLVGLKDVIPNFIGWIVLQKRGQIKEGKTIDIREIYGVIEKVGYLETEIRTERGDILYVPNSLFLKSKYSLRK